MTVQKPQDRFAWYAADLIRGIPHFISPAWNHDRSKFDPEHYARMWKEAGFSSVTLLTNHHDGFCLYPSEHVAQKPKRDFFGEQVAACKAQDMKVIAYYSLSLNSLIGSEHPEWRIRDVRGRVHTPDYQGFAHYHWLCMNSPYRDLALAQFREIISRYDVRGLWLDILYLPPISADDELETRTCFCDHCHRTYSDWFKGEHLIDALGTSRHDEFQAMTFAAFLKETRTLIHSLDDSVLLTYNGAGVSRRPYYYLCEQYADTLNAEAHTPFKQQITAKYVKRDGRPFEVLSCSEICWSHNSLKPDQLIMLEALNTAILGGVYTLGITHAPNGFLDQENVARIGKIHARLKRYEPYFKQTEPVYDVAILKRTDVRESEIANELVPNILSDPGISMVLGSDHILHEVISTADNLDRYRAVIVPCFRAVSEKEHDALRTFVEAGGSLFIESPSYSKLDEGALMLADLAGIRKVGTRRPLKRDLYNQTVLGATYVRLADTVIGRQLSRDIFPGMHILFEAEAACLVELTGADEVASLHFEFEPKDRLHDIQTVPNTPGPASGFPGLTINSVGRGKVIFSAVPIFVRNSRSDTSPWTKALAQNIVSYLIGAKDVSVPGFPRIEVFVTRRDESLFLHFFNHSFEPGENLPFRAQNECYCNVRIALSEDLAARAASIELLPAGTPLDLDSADQGPGFVLPRLEIYSLVRICTR